MQSLGKNHHHLRRVGLVGSGVNSVGGVGRISLFGVVGNKRSNRGSSSINSSRSIVNNKCVSIKSSSSSDTSSHYFLDNHRKEKMSTMIMPASPPGTMNTNNAHVEKCFEHYEDYSKTNNTGTSIVDTSSQVGNKERTWREFHKKLILSQKNNSVNHSHVMGLLQWWCSQKTPESVQKSIELLPYLTNNSNSNHQQQFESEVVETSTLNKVLDNWRLCWKRQQENHDYHRTIHTDGSAYSSLLVPKQILKIIDTENNSLFQTIPNTKTYNLILDASVSYMAVRSSQPRLFQHTNAGDNDNHRQIQSDCIDETLRISKDIFNRMYQTNFYSPSSSSSLSLPRNESITNLDTNIDITTFTTMIRLWNQSKQVSGPSEGLKLLRLYQKLYEEDAASVNNQPPNNILYGAVMESYVRQILQIPDAVPIVEQLHQEMVEQSKLFPNQIYPTTMSMASVITAHTKGINYDSTNNSHKRKTDEQQDVAAMRAYSMLQQMIQSYRQTKQEHVKPDSFCFSLVLWALSKRGMATQAEELLHTMVEMYEDDIYNGNNESSSSLYPDHTCWTAVQNAFSQIGDVPKSVEICQNIQNYAKITNSSRQLKLNNQNMNLLLQAHAESGNHNSSKEAERILEQMETHYHGHNHYHMKPTRITYGAVMGCYANSKNSSISNVKKIERILNRMEEKYLMSNNNDVDLKPNTYMYNTLLNAYAQCRNLDDSTIGHVIELFYKMKQSSSMTGSNKKDKHVSIRPNRFTYTTLLAMFAKNPKYQQSASAAQYIFNQMKAEYEMNPEADRALKPTKQQYNLLLNTYANAGDGHTAEQILNEMNHLYKQDPVNNQDCYPCTLSYNQVLAAWSKRSQNNKYRKEVKSNYNNKYHSSATSDDTMEELLLASNHAEKIFTRMQKLANNNNSDDKSMKELPLPKVEPDMISLGSLLHCYVQSKQCERADQVLYFVQKQYDAAREKIITEIDNGNCAISNSSSISTEPISVLKPNMICYNTVIDAWSKMSSELSHAPSRAENLFHEMTRRNKEYDDISFKPDKQTYTSLIHAWYKSSAVHNNGDTRHEQKLHSKPHIKSQQLLDDMIAKYEHNPSENSDLCPDNYIYTAVMNAWAKHGLMYDSNNTFDSQMDAINHIESLFLDMISRYKKMEENKSNNNNRKLLPDIVCINTLLKAYHIVLKNNSYHNNNDAAVIDEIVEKVESIINFVEHEKSLSCQPNRITFSSLEKIREYRQRSGFINHHAAA